MKRTFKDFLEADLNKVFFNDNEFATSAIIEGERVKIIVDDDVMKERQLKIGAQGVHNEELLFYAQKSEIPFYPRPDNVVLFDECRWLIQECNEDMGMFTIKATRTSG